MAVVLVLIHSLPQLFQAVVVVEVVLFLEHLVGLVEEVLTGIRLVFQVIHLSAHHHKEMPGVMVPLLQALPLVTAEVVVVLAEQEQSEQVVAQRQEVPAEQVFQTILVARH
jgi:hypothetical protein